jgi:diguanylate cyclase
LNLQKALTEILKETEGVSLSMSEIGSRLAANHAEVERLRDELRQAKELSLIDALSQLTNRRGFDLALDAMVTGARESAEPLSLILVDIDHFKQFNDTYGHLLGDRVIRGVARAMTLAVRTTDVVARYGGEEFAVLLPNTGVDEAGKVAERIRASIARAHVRRVDDDLPVGGVTVSAGVAIYRAPEPALEFVSRADKALFAAKFAGRNRVHLRVE